MRGKSGDDDSDRGTRRARRPYSMTTPFRSSGDGG
jgi:hypothetical protein